MMFSGQRWAVGEVLEEDWKQFIKGEGLSASVDFPMSLFCKWYLSVKNSIRQIGTFIDSWGSLPLRLVSKLTGKSGSPASLTTSAPTYLGPKYPRGMFGAIDAGEETAVRFFNDWKAQVIRDVPADRLLVFEVKEGWAPLCKFLGVPQPEGPFPNTNDTKEMQRKLGVLKKICFAIWISGATTIGLSAYFLRNSVGLLTITFN